MPNITDVSNAYSNILNQTKESSMPEVNGASFKDLLKDKIEGAVESQHTSEKMSAQAVAGNADITDVLQAVTDAEMTLNTVMAVRDRVISAYQQILRTPI